MAYGVICLSFNDLYSSFMFIFDNNYSTTADAILVDDAVINRVYF